VGLPICDPKSYPQNPCTPDSDTNSGSISDPNGAGSAFLELQLYPPGFTPFIDGESCSKTHWCSALNIDSLECTFGFAPCNNNCIEPVNFSYLTDKGVPTGPASPQLTDASTFLPNGHTLFMNGGDVLLISISDPPGGLTARIIDLTTHRTGYVVASATNGFMNTNIADCSGTPFTFHAEYNTAQQQNQVPWAALEGGVLMQQEIGHAEACNSLTNRDPFLANYPDGQSYSDKQVFDTCVGGSDPTSGGEGPCGPAGCQNATTQGPTGPVACPANDPASAALCEFADGNCFPKGDRTVLINGSPTTESSPLNFCFAGRFQNGDLDFDGTDYVPNTWPDGSPNHPTPASYLGPFTGGRTYTTIQFETDVGGSENLCNTGTGAGCTAPPIGADFYPFWSLGSHGPQSLPAWMAFVSGTSAMSSRRPLTTLGKTRNTARRTSPGTGERWRARRCQTRHSASAADRRGANRRRRRRRRPSRRRLHAGQVRHAVAVPARVPERMRVGVTPLQEEM
jgi:hypothetical protein